MANQSRLYSIDTLRAIAMLLGIVLHGSIAYKSGRQFNLWIIDNDFNSYFYDWLYLYINSFRMQLFFLLAGFFACVSLRKRGVRDFFQNRLKRLGLPLALAYFTILPLTLAPFMYFLFMQEAAGDPTIRLTQFLKDFFTLKERSGLMHLWFIYYLLLYTICVSIGFALFNKLRMGSWKLVSMTLSRGRLWTYTIVLTLFVALIAQGYPSEVPNIWTGFFPRPVQFLYYGAFFAAGVFLDVHRVILKESERVYIPFLIIGSLLSFVHVTLINIGFTLTPVMTIVYKCTFAVETVLLIIGLLGLFSARLNKPSPLTQLMSESAYWVYLIHLPLVLFLQLAMLDSWVPGVLRFPIVVIITLAVAISTYLLLVRGKWLGKILDGK